MSAGSRTRNILIAALIAAGAIGAVVAGLYLAPGHQELALMQLNDFHYKDALKDYASLQEKGDNGINVIYPLINLYVHEGDVDKAIELMQSFVAQHPQSLTGHRKLAELYKASQRFHNYCKELEKLQALSPSAETLRELADTYDFLGMYESEMGALSKLVESRGYKPREEDYVNLAGFLRVDHRNAKAAETMLALITLKKYVANIDSMHLAMQLLLEQGDRQQAFSIAKEYVARNNREADAIVLSELFQQQRLFGGARALLEPFLANISRSPALMQQLVALELAQGKYADVYEMLMGQFKKGALPDSLTASLIDLAIKYKNLALADSVMHKVHLEKVPEDDLLRYSYQWSVMKRPDMARYMQARLGKEYLSFTPLLADVLELSAHDSPAALAALLAMPPDNIVQPEQKAIVAGVYLQRGYNERAYALLSALPASNTLGVLDEAQYVQLYLDVNQGEKALQLLNAARPVSTPEIQEHIDTALLLLAAGRGEAKPIEKWLKDYPEADVAWMSEACELASRYHRNELALTVAQRLYSVQPTTENRMQLIDALLLNHHYAEAMAKLQTLTLKDPKLRDMYLDIVANWIHSAKGMPPGSHGDLDTHIAAIVRDASIQPGEKRNIAYDLEDAGFKEQAEGIFQLLAASQPFASKDVQELLGVWGEKLSPTALAWIADRARNASGAEKARWLGYLNDAEHPETVLALLSGDAEPVAKPRINNTPAAHDLAAEPDSEDSSPAEPGATSAAAIHDLTAEPASGNTGSAGSRVTKEAIVHDLAAEPDMEPGADTGKETEGDRAETVADKGQAATGSSENAGAPTETAPEPRTSIISANWAPEVAGEYISALAATHQRQQLHDILEQEIGREQNLTRLKKLATIANDENLPAISQKGWQKIYALDPENAEAQKMLGLHAFNANRYADAKRLLKPYMQHNKADYKVNYAYGEILHQEGKPEEARPYFRRALAQLNQVDRKNVENWLDEAHLLYRNNRQDESAALFRKLRAQYPKNGLIRRDFAEMLIENQQYGEARLVLKK